MGYVLECMLIVILATVPGGSSRPMFTTGREPILKDAGVGLVGWWVLSFFVLCVAFLIWYLIKLKKHKNTVNNLEASNLDEQSSSKKVINPFLYILECMALCFLCMHGGINRPMITTGQKPKSKDVVSAISGWGYFILLIVGIILICK